MISRIKQLLSKLRFELLTNTLCVSVILVWD